MIKQWLVLRSAGVSVPFWTLLAMSSARILTTPMVKAIIISAKEDLGFQVAALKSHALCGGNPENLVMAAFWLRERGEKIEGQLLAILDLLPQVDLVRLVQVWTQTKAVHPGLTFDELAQRSMAGEDLLSLAEQGELAPLAVERGWGVRIVYEDLSSAELRQILTDHSQRAQVLIRPPRRSEWKPLSQMSDLMNW